MNIARTGSAFCLLVGLLAVAPGASAATAVPQVGTEPGSSYWAPTQGATWQLQYTGRLNTSVPAAIFDIDGFDTSAATVRQLHASGRKAICYLSAGTWEDWRPDASQFSSSVLGTSDGWPGERWLDIQNLDAIMPIVQARVSMCRAKGFDAIDFDNVDAYTHDTGFALDAGSQLVYNRLLSDAAHAAGMSVGLKNDIEQVPQLVSRFDFAINEQCYQYSECDLLRPFIAAGKAVLHIEYSVAAWRFCPVTKSLGFSSIRKRMQLDSWRQAC